MNSKSSPRALRQSRARTKRKALAYVRPARSDLQGLVGNFKREFLFMRLLCNVRHNFILAVGSKKKGCHPCHVVTALLAAACRKKVAGGAAAKVQFRVG